MAHKFGRKLFMMDVREIRTSLQNDAKDGYNLDGREIMNLGQEFYKLSFVRAKA